MKNGNKIFRIIFLILVLLAIALVAKKEIVPKENPKNEPTDSNVPKVISAAEILESDTLCRDILGFGGHTPLRIYLNSEDCIMDIELLPNAESASYLGHIQKSNYLAQWIGKSATEALQMQTDALSGATYTSTAIKKNIERTLSVYTKAEEKSENAFNRYLRIVSALLVLVFGLLSFFFPFRYKKYRYVLLAASVLILGFWQAQSLSLSLFYSFLSGGFSWTHAFLILVLTLAILLPFFTNKSFYCMFLCPYGAAQELLGKIPVKKWQISSRFLTGLSNTRVFLTLLSMFLAITGLVDDFSKTEIFSGFTFMIASPLALILFGTFLLLSIFIPRVWCRFFCPPGYILQLFQNK